MAALPDDLTNLLRALRQNDNSGTTILGSDASIAPPQTVSPSSLTKRATGQSHDVPHTEIESPKGDLEAMQVAFEKAKNGWVQAILDLETTVIAYEGLQNSLVNASNTAESTGLPFWYETPYKDPETGHTRILRFIALPSTAAGQFNLSAGTQQPESSFHSEAVSVDLSGDGMDFLGDTVETLIGQATRRSTCSSHSPKSPGRARKATVCDEEEEGKVMDLT